MKSIGANAAIIAIRAEFSRGGIETKFTIINTIDGLSMNYKFTNTNIQLNITLLYKMFTKIPKKGYNFEYKTSNSPRSVAIGSRSDFCRFRSH